MKKALVLFLILLFFIPSISSAVKVTLEDGTEINTDGLSDSEKQQFLQYLEKVNDATKENMKDTASSVLMETAKDPAKLNEWRKLLTGTIKDICNDLNVTVNEFVKTPVGLGISALIFYKVAGKDLMSGMTKLAILTPLFFIILTLCLFLGWRFLGSTTEYIHMEDVEFARLNSATSNVLYKYFKGGKDNKYNIKIPVKQDRYEWESGDAKTAFSCIIFGLPIAFILISLLILFG